ncbi:MAG: DUF1697 domain-containing protein [Gemmatimonadota bacterium]
MSSRYVAFLRAINVGGRVVPMAELRTHFEALGLNDVSTFIASGNVIFSSRAKSVAALEKRVAAGLHEELGYEVPVFIRSAAEVAAIARQKPFTAPQMKLSKTFVVGLLAEPLGADAKKALMAMQSDLDLFHVDGREIYWTSRLAQSESVISNNALEKALKVRSTFRGMNTMVRLVEKFDL